jgi:hypothetical protein
MLSLRRLDYLQDQPSQSLGTFTATPAAATIPAKGSCTISLSLEAARLGRLQLPVLVRVAGSRNKPLQIIADATAVGPSLDFALLPANTAAVSAAAGGNSSAAGGQLLSVDGGTGIQPAAAVPEEGGVAFSNDSSLLAEASSVSAAASTTSTSTRAKASKRSAAGSKSKAGSKAEPPPLEWTAAPAICFGKVQVLQQHDRELRLRNSTLIDAEVKLFVEGKDSVFEVGWRDENAAPRALLQRRSAAHAEQQKTCTLPCLCCTSCTLHWQCCICGVSCLYCNALCCVCTLQVEPREAVVPAGGELSVLVRVVLDDTTKFKDVLHALVAEGADVNIPLEATGELSKIMVLLSCAAAHVQH